MSSATLVTATHVSYVTEFTTYCPLSTTLTVGNKTYATSGSVTIPYTSTAASNISSNGSTIQTANGAAGKGAIVGSVAGALALAAVLL